MSKTSSFPPVYQHKFQQASEHLRRALPLVNRYKTPVNPVNYAVWYEYVSGDNQALSQAIDNLLEKGENITTETTQQFYEQYVLMGIPDRLNKTNSGLKLVVDNTLANIQRAESTASNCSNDLSHSEAMLESCRDVQELKALITDILDNTRQLTASSQALKTELSRTSEEIIRLRKELEAVKESARTDSLTGLLNRGAFDQELSYLVNSRHISLSLALFDIDKFKSLNDRYGHLVGDKVLQYFASILKDHRDGIHVAARFGGEEMAMIFIHTPQQQAHSIAETIRQQFAESHLKKKGSDESIGQVTVSVGITSMLPGDTVQQLLNRADKALYRSKAEGRNRVSLS